MSDRVTTRIEDGVADVRLNRPDKLNALDQEMFVGLADTAARLAADPSVRAVVLSGQGRAFCAGLDFSGFMAMAGSGDREAAGGRDTDRGPAGGGGGTGRGSTGGGGGEGRDGGGGDAGMLGALGSTGGRITHLGQQAVHGWSEVPAPVIAAVHGHCLGGGLQIALGADLRIAHPDAKLSVLEIRWGLTPDMTGTATLRRLVRPDVAKELTWTGRTVSGREAAGLGLVTRLSDDPLADALALAREVAGKNPHAVRGAKRLLDAPPGTGPAEQYAAERAEIGALVGSPNQAEAVTAYFEKRPPSFSDPD